MKLVITKGSVLNVRGNLVYKFSWVQEDNTVFLAEAVDLSVNDYVEVDEDVLQEQIAFAKEHKNDVFPGMGFLKAPVEFT